MRTLRGKAKERSIEGRDDREAETKPMNWADDTKGKGKGKELLWRGNFDYLNILVLA